MHNKHNALEPSWNHPPTTGSWKKMWSKKPVPGAKKVGDPWPKGSIGADLCTHLWLISHPSLSCLFAVDKLFILLFNIHLPQGLDIYYPTVPPDIRMAYFLTSYRSLLNGFLFREFSRSPYIKWHPQPSYFSLSSWYSYLDFFLPPIKNEAL